MPPILALLAAIAATPLALPAAAQEGTLTMGLSVTPSSFDPQLGALGSDETYYSHVYDALFMRSPTTQPIPKLATGYTLVDDLTWEIDLRQGVTFHDGSAFDADDVLFTLERLPTVEGSDGLNAEKMDVIERVEVIDPHKIRIVTETPVPNMITLLYTIFIISDELDPSVTTAQFNSGEAAIGTGPYEFVEWKQGEDVVLRANADYFEGAPEFETVILRELPNSGSRVAALLAGDVDYIDAVPPLDVARLEENEEVSVFSGPSGRVIFIQFQSGAAPHPDVTAKGGGEPLDPNPLGDARVRQALATAMDQELLIDRVMDGLAVTATQAVPEGYLGFSPDVQPPSGDAEAARALLEEAGYPDGFALTVSCPNDRYVNDAAICQAVGQMLARVGVEATVDTMPRAAYFGPMREGEFAAWMLGWGNSQGHAGSVLPSVMRSDASWNGGTAFPEIDLMIDEAVSIMDAEARGEAFGDVMEALAAEAAYVPLLTQTVVVATRAGLAYEVMADETSLAVNVSRTE